MKTILIAFLFIAPFGLHAQSTGERDRSAQKCDELMGQEKEACLKQGGTVKASSAAGGSTTPKSKGKKDHPKPEPK